MFNLLLNFVNVNKAMVIMLLFYIYFAASKFNEKMLT